jgi:hypothetical protein
VAEVVAEVAEPILMANPFWMAMQQQSVYTEVSKILVDKFTVLCLNAYDQILSVSKIADAG